MSNEKFTVPSTAVSASPSGVMPYAGSGAYCASEDAMLCHLALRCASLSPSRIFSASLRAASEKPVIRGEPEFSSKRAKAGVT